MCWLQHVTEVCFSSNCTKSLWNREDDWWRNQKIVCVCKTSGSSWKERGFPNCSCKHKVGYTTIGRETLRTNSCWHTLSAICLPGSAGQRTAMSSCNHEVHRRRHQKCVLCACQFHLHQGSKKVISFPDSLDTLKKTSVQNDRSRLAQLSATSGRRRNNMSNRKPPALFVVASVLPIQGVECRKTTGRIFCDLFEFNLVCKTRSFCLLEQHAVSQTSHRKRTSLTSASSARAAPSVGQSKSLALSSGEHQLGVSITTVVEWGVWWVICVGCLETVGV